MMKTNSTVDVIGGEIMSPDGILLGIIIELTKQSDILPSYPH
jgi:hypothetical protein